MGYCKLGTCRHNGEPTGDLWRDGYKVCRNECMSHVSALDLAKGHLDKMAKVQVKTEPCVILYNGKVLKLNSGKSSWINKGAARTAFTSGVCYDARKFGFLDSRHMREVLEEEGIIKFVSIKYE